jgi:hypothetical protein
MYPRLDTIFGPPHVEQLRGALEAGDRRDEDGKHED